MHSFVRLWALCLAAVIAFVATSVTPAASPIEPPRLPRLAAQSSPTILKGDAARTFRTQLLATNARYAEAQRRSAERMRARGFVPTNEVVVVLVPRQSPLLQPASHAGGNFFLSPVRLRGVQTYESGEGYMVLNSWNDGNNATWEGNMYFVDNVEGIETSVDNQEDVSGYEPPPVLWAQGDMWGPGHEPIPISFAGAKKLLRPRSAGFTAGAPGTFGPGAFTGAMQNRCRCGMLRLAKCFVQNGWSDAWPWCVGSLAGSFPYCAFLGSLSVPCVLGSSAGGCATAFVAYTVIVIRDHWRECTADNPEMCAL